MILQWILQRRRTIPAGRTAAGALILCRTRRPCCGASGSIAARSPPHLTKSSRPDGTSTGRRMTAQTWTFAERPLNRQQSNPSSQGIGDCETEISSSTAISFLPGSIDHQRIPFNLRGEAKGLLICGLVSVEQSSRTRGSDAVANSILSRVPEASSGKLQSLGSGPARISTLACQPQHHGGDQIRTNDQSPLVALTIH
jgi:hypothetical protein